MLCNMYSFTEYLLSTLQSLHSNGRMTRQQQQDKLAKYIIQLYGNSVMEKNKAGKGAKECLYGAAIWMKAARECLPENGDLSKNLKGVRYLYEREEGKSERH